VAEVSQRGTVAYLQYAGRNNMSNSYADFMVIRKNNLSVGQMNGIYF
jgi:hypothetical protein